MNLHRISVKFYLTPAPGSPAADSDAIIGVFHDWIQHNKAPGMLIDVADYSHMADGPGVMLIGDDVEYALDNTEQRPGLLHVRKRGKGSLAEMLPSLFSGAISACNLLSTQLGMSFVTNEIKLTLLDRLNTPNTDATFDELAGEIQSFASTLFEGEVTLERDSQDQRCALAVRIKADQSPDFDELQKRLSATAV